MTYVDGMIAAVPTARKDDWLAFAKRVAPVFLAHGATRIVDCWGSDLPRGKFTDFFMSVKAEANETVCFSWIEWPSKAIRDAGFEKAMADPAMQPGAIEIPFDGKRMVFGGFDLLSDLKNVCAENVEISEAAAPLSARTLTLARVLDAPVKNVWRCWTEPALLTEWFCPKPWRVSEATIEPRAGGAFHSTMNGPNGEVMPNKGQLLVVEPEKRLVFTDAFVGDWAPSGKAFMVAEVTFAAEGAKTRYVATARHWSATDCKAHDEMGFHQGWGAAADQLEALAKSL